MAELNKASLSGLLHDFAAINFLHFAAFLFLLCVAVLVVVSLATPPPPESRLAGLTFATTSAADRKTSRATWNALDVLLSVAIVGLVAAVMIYFRG